GNSTSSNGPTNNGPYDTKGSDYVLLTANTQVSAHFRGAARTFDLNGSLTQLDSIDQDRIAVIMSNAVMLGLPGYSIGAYDDHGNLTNNGQPVGYSAEANGIVYASDNNLINKAIVLPNDLSAGSWNPDPNGDPAYIANLTNHMASFTTYNGGTYSNIIEVTASSSSSKSNITANIYFAKDIGPIQIDLVHAEQDGYNITGNNNNYEKVVYSGSIARNGP
ncbi:MAG: hypothetical protein ACHQNE_09370, partial [Candidatus Kapaibacterium sp.]